MEIALTEVSEREFESIVYGHMTPRVAAAYLQAKPEAVRGFGETLRHLYPAPDLLERLKAFYLVLDPAANERSVTKKLQNWLGGRNQPSDREDLFRITFALDLSEAQLNYLLGLSTGYTIQYRDGRELVLSWFLRSGRTYAEALDFFDTLPAYEPANELSGEMHSRLTHEIETGFAAIAALDELRAAYERNLGNFGTQHLRAYFYFERYLDRLIAPEPLFEGDEVQRYSIERVTEEYLGLAMPLGKNRSSLSLVQKLIKQNWPNATAVKNIRNHTEDVPRKLLLLLYVATENAGFAEEDDEYFGLEEEGLEDRIRDHWWIVNAMLTDCGMAPLDLRNAFDWLVLYAIAAPEDEAMSERMQQVIALMYGSEESVEG